MTSPAATDGSEPRRALDGVRVLALEASVSAPHCSRLLGDLGAEVIKIEKPKVGDILRQWDSAVRGLASGYVWLNYNKRSFAIDVKKPSGLAAVEKLAAQVDVFLENFAPGVAERLGLGPEKMCHANSRLIYCSISGYGQDGPYRDVKAYDLLIQGEAGVIATTGTPDQPAKVSLPIADLAVSMYATIGIVAALYERERTGRGQVIDVSMFESLLSWLGYFPHHFWHRGEEPERVGMRHHFVTPYGPFLAGDGFHVNLAVATPNDWELFCRHVIQRADLLDDPRFSTSELRRKNRVELEKTLDEIFLTKPSAEWLQLLEAARLPHGVVRNIGQVLAHPQTIARGVIQQVETPVGVVPVIASALRMRDSVPRLDPVPALGADTEAILAALGVSPIEIARMKVEGSI
jgi:itaconate CoA-transferase